MACHISGVGSGASGPAGRGTLSKSMANCFQYTFRREMEGGWVDGWVDGWMGEWMGGPMKGEMGGWMDRWMGGWVDACRMAVCALHLHAGARLLRIRVAIVVHRTYLVERVAREVDPLEHGTHRAAEPATTHANVHAHVHAHVHDVTCVCTCTCTCVCTGTCTCTCTRTCTCTCTCTYTCTCAMCHVHVIEPIAPRDLFLAITPRLASRPVPAYSSKASVRSSCLCCAHWRSACAGVQVSASECK
jgi:hypothetical protein